jgi:hypothetical protein
MMEGSGVSVIGVSLAAGRPDLGFSIFPDSRTPFASEIVLPKLL